MNRISERAGALGLFATANALADAKIDPNMAPKDPRLTEKPGADIKRIFGQMARRGHDPQLVGALRAKLEKRPFERALVAVDVLAQSIWSPRDPLLAQLRADAETLGDVRPPANDVGIDLNAHPAVALLERFARTPEIGRAGEIELLAYAYEQHLGVFAELHHRGDDLLARQGTRDSIQAFARLASLARLPTLASIYFDFLQRGLSWPEVAFDLCETLFDAGVPHKIPGSALQGVDVSKREQRDVAEYCALRAHIALGDTGSANALFLQSMEQRPRWSGMSSPKVDVVSAHLGLLYDHGESALARVEAACTVEPLWRYAAMVRAIVASKRAPNRARELWHAHLAAFGNDFDCTFTVIRLVPEAVKRDVARFLCREAFHLPHEPAPWKLLGALFGVDDAVRDEIEARLGAQSA
ncbi:MAG: hypothetical protein H0T46_12455 [Deltaproteobacteria bacterium]|nr:hypothetical protein [Deltaproteobacteria bacterium]